VKTTYEGTASKLANACVLSCDDVFLRVGTSSYARSSAESVILKKAFGVFSARLHMNWVVTQTQRAPLPHIDFFDTNRFDPTFIFENILPLDSHEDG
jgi:hypothetical protein